ncbi:MAG: hypothetical protein E7653_07505 [Ruminococcaceae bacterium]|nr:hypothetical protein [Oscillospiraceae bacterium]
MKKVNFLQLIASICILAGSVINLLELFIELPEALRFCSSPLLLVGVILYFVSFGLRSKRKKRKKNKKNKKDK